MNYIFYDTETTGLDTTFDQILQFAAILTDAEFIELDRIEIRCRIQPHIIPAPEALLVTRISPDMLNDPHLVSHYQFMQKIVKVLNDWSPAVFLGYNTINFDELLLRQAFYQTLHPTFLTNTNGNQRGDVLRFIQAASTLRPDVINIPKNNRGMPTLKLDVLAPANGFAHESAHDALGDVQATIYMANLVRKRAPDIWETLIPLVDKSKVNQMINNNKVNCLIEYFGGSSSVRAIVGCCAPDTVSSLISVFDLTYDPEEYFDLSVNEIVKVMNSSKKAIRIIYTNKMPAIIKLEHLRNPEHKFKLALSEIQKRADRVNNAGQFHKNVACALKLRFAREEKKKVLEERIFEGFPNISDQKLMKEFHSGDIDKKIETITLFKDERYKEIAQRLVFLENQMALESDIRDKLRKWVNNRRHGLDGVSTGRTIKDVISRIDSLLEDMPESHAEILAIKNWLLT